MKVSPYVILITLVILTFISYGSLVWFLTPDFNVKSIEKLGVFGDSFGVLTSFFSGLAFAGMIVTILLQRDELRLQREELKRNSEAQETQAKLAALTALLSEYKSQAKIFELALEDGTMEIENLSETGLQNAMSKYYEKQHAVVREIEKLLMLSGINLDSET